jgi:hypothetical protein
MKSSDVSLPYPGTISALWWTVLAVPFIIYSLTVLRYSANVPYMDDYDAALKFVSTFTQLQNTEAKIALLFAQHNEHRIVLDRLVFSCSHFLFGELNFRFLIAFGNLGWIFTTLLLVVYFRNNFHLSLPALLPIPYLLLSFSHSESMFFAMAAIQNYWFIFFSIVFLMGLSKDKPLVYCALFPLALFTSGGGIVLYPLGSLYLGLRRKWRSFAWFLALSTPCMLLYFYHYQKPAYLPGVLNPMLFPFRTTAYYFSFWGNLLPMDELSLFLGFVLCLGSTYLVFKRYGDSFLRLTIGFIALIAATLTMTRSSIGVWQSLSSRYSIFSLLVLICVYMFVLTSIAATAATHKKLILGAILFAVSFWGIDAVYYQQTQKFLKDKDDRVATVVAFANGDIGGLLYPDKDRAARILLTARQLHIYDYRYP